MAKDKLAIRRSRYTLQGYEHALESIRRDGRQHGPIPRAAPHQAFLEALALERIGEWKPACWRPDILGFGIAWIDPSPTGITLGVPTRYLPDIASTLMPTSSAAELVDPIDGESAQIYGLPGLRFRLDGSTVILHIPGMAGRIEIPLASPGLWEKALLIAQASFDDTTVFFWDLLPDTWHPLERACAASWPERYVIGGIHYQASRLASGVLRRLPGICRPFSAHDMWFNFGRDLGYEIEFEWQDSGPPRDVLDLLLHHKDGLNVRIDSQGMPLNHFYSENCTYVRLLGDTGGCLDLRRLRHSPETREALKRYRAARGRDRVAERRLELERKYNYPSSETFLGP
ncbi:hypothetical protein [Nonomuraea aurantiaca]|uniref:hypothetical protein n=1 Tax=Nonomuraea aurantiaca TaxID=2878562 RepID=UPI001CDA2449|nr:hypothetical protein [Nonomuraea aurantiaca]MCA2230196.1 hypothetical protein [Nonomuraea aurantiaca]